MVGESDGRHGTKKALICALVNPSPAIQIRSCRTALEKDELLFLCRLQYSHARRHRKLSLLFDTPVSRRIQKSRGANGAYP